MRRTVRSAVRDERLCAGVRAATSMAASMQPSSVASFVSLIAVVIVRGR
jgi:hypothetical protein